MSEKYIPLYRKYRPQTFYDLIGQEHITTALSNAIELNRISHAYLFCGPRGTGKTSSARILAKSLNCTEGPTLNPCGKCPSCVDITNSTPMDVIEIDAASNRSIDDTQKILEKIQYVPVHGKYKIYVIDEVHMLSTTSFNALLKTLEEPPENVIFILATTEPQKVLETIISRCQRFDFRRITTEDIVKRLRFISDEEKINITDEALSAIARSSAGGMRDSLSLLDQVSILDVKKQIDIADIDNLLGKISNDFLYNLIENIISQYANESIKLIDEIYNKGNEPSQVITNLIQYMRNLLVLRNVEDIAVATDLTQLNEHYIKKMKEQAQKCTSEQIIFLIEKLSNYLKELRTATNRYLWLELCIIDLSTSCFSSYSELMERIEKLEASISSGNCTPSERKILKPVQNSVSLKVSPAPQLNESVQEIDRSVKPEPQKQATQTQSNVPAIKYSATDDDWQGILANIEHTPSKVLFSTKAFPVEISAEKVVLAFSNEIQVLQAKDTNKIAAIQAAVDKFFGKAGVNVQIRQQTDDEKQKIKTPTQFDKKKTNVISAKSDEESPRQVKDEEDENSYYDSLLAQNNEEKKIEEISVEDYSDQANLALDLFNGKYID